MGIVVFILHVPSIVCRVWQKMDYFGDHGVVLDDFFVAILGTMVELICLEEISLLSSSAK